LGGMWNSVMGANSFFEQLLKIRSKKNAKSIFTIDLIEVII
jgi:hypothetical protein